MAKSNPLQRRLGEAIEQRGIRRIVYFHTDHFEPWRTFDGRDAVGPENGDDLARFADAMQRIDFARRLTLFCKPHLNYGMRDGADAIRVPGDKLGFYSRTAAQEADAKKALGYIVSSTQHEFQLHVHHEGYTFNTTLSEPGIKAYLNTPEGRDFDDARLTLGIRLGLDILRRETGRALDRWFFVHGHWALNASDAHDCHVTREIEILLQEGCCGDFTFPAGRSHVDPRHEVPYLVRPNNVAKGYDFPEAEPEPAFGATEAARRKFFIWASRAKNNACSIDYSSPSVRRRADNIEAAARALIDNSYFENGTLYIKTHAHAMHPVYFELSRSPVYPHQYPATQAMLGQIFDACASSGADLSFLTASEVYDDIVGAPIRSPVNLLAPNAGAALVTRSKHAGVLGGGSASLAKPVSAKVARGASKRRRASAVLREIHAMPLDRRAAWLNDIVCEFILSRIDAMGLHASGCEGSHQQDALNKRGVRTVEVELVRRITAAELGAGGILQIGSGLGLVTALLGLDGTRATGIEKDGRRFDAAQDLLVMLDEACPGLSTLVRNRRGRYPRAIPVRTMATSVAVIINLIAPHTAAELQAMIGALAGHRAVILDTMRFVDWRDTSEQRTALIERFAEAGFDPPEPFLDCGNDGYFMLFRPRPAARARALLVAGGNRLRQAAAWGGRRLRPRKQSGGSARSLP